MRLIYAQSVSNYELNSIEFEGNNNFSSSQLSSVIYSQESPGWLWQFLNSFTPLGAEAVYFDSSNIKLDLNALNQFYNENGYFDAEISYEYNVDTTDKVVDLIYKIKENQPSDYGKVELKGIDSVHKPLYSDLYNAIILDTTSRYEESSVHQKINNIVGLLTNEGYMFANFDSTIVYRDTVKDKANLDVYFTTGKRYKIDSILINTKGEGADQVNDNMLKNIIGIREGDYYSLDKIKRSQARLFRTGLFNTLFLSAVGNDTTDSVVPLKLEGTIGLMNELSPELIMNNQQSAFNLGFGATYVRKNFLGEARKLTIGSSFGVQDIFNADLSNLIRKFSFRDTTLLGYFDSRLTIEQPFLFNKPIYGTWENYATINKQSNFNYTVYGSKLTMDFELPSYTFINYLSTYYNLEVSNEVYRTFNDSLSSKLISLIGADFGSSTVDDILFPTKGYNLSLLVEEANSIPYVISKISNGKFDGSLFYKVQSTYSTYFSLNLKRTSIFAMKFKAGQLHAYIGNYAGIPLNRTFYAGGSNSIRGWRANQLVPAGTDTVLFSKGPNVKGGTFLLEGSFEYRYRFINDFGIALFTDYGNTWLGYKSVTWDGFAVAAGWGFRYYSSIAPFRLDFGFKFYNPADKSFIFKKDFWHNLEIHFGIGEAF